MKKLSMRIVTTVLSYTTVKEVEGVPTAVNEIEFIDGKLSEKKAKEYLKETPHLTGSVSIKILDDRYRIPYDVIEKLITACNTDGFVKKASVDEPYRTLDFGKEIEFITYTSDLDIIESSIAIVGDEIVLPSQGCPMTTSGTTTFIRLPVHVYTWLLEEYVVEKAPEREEANEE